MDDKEFLKRFEDTSLPYEAWTHRAHVKVAFLYVRDLEFEAATDQMRQGIQRFNRAKNVPEGPTMGYNETTTVAFMRLVRAMYYTYQESMPVESADAFCDTHPQLMNRQVLRLYYSPARRLHPDAKTTFVEPDLAPLPVPPEEATTAT